MTTHKIEPDAWRWRFDDEGQWNFGSTKPGQFRFMPPTEMEELYTTSQWAKVLADLYLERQAREKAEAERDYLHIELEKCAWELKAALARIKEAEKVIAPFAKLGANFVHEDYSSTKADSQTVWGFNNDELTYGDFRAAANFLEGPK
jgi:hypothetical protein